MIKRVLTAVFVAIILFAIVPTTFAAQRYTRSQQEQIRHRRHKKTVKRVGIGVLEEPRSVRWQVRGRVQLSAEPPVRAPAISTIGIKKIVAATRNPVKELRVF